jgi:hypothetical protein
MSAQGDIQFQDGEETRRLYYGINSLCSLEGEFGLAIEEIAQKLTGFVVVNGTRKKAAVRMTDVRSIFRAGLIEYWPGGSEPSHNEAGQIITRLGMAETSSLIERAFKASLGADTDGGGDEGKAAKT